MKVTASALRRRVEGRKIRLWRMLSPVEQGEESLVEGGTTTEIQPDRDLTTHGPLHDNAVIY
jgi:hypothetical protein